MRIRSLRIPAVVTALVVVLSLLPVCTLARAGGEQQGLVIPGLALGGDGDGAPKRLGIAIEIVLALTVLSLAPAILVMLTSFTRIIVVFSFVRQALGTQQMPPSQLLIGLALFLTIVIMFPVFNEVYDSALKPYLDEEIDQKTALGRGFEPIKTFMLGHAREKDIGLFLKMRGFDKPVSPENLPASVLIPGFIISELRTAFQMGFLVYLPFLVIDMVVASVLMSMGMLMLPPVMISLPFKILLFVLVDGWHLLVQSLVSGFTT